MIVIYFGLILLFVCWCSYWIYRDFKNKKVYILGVLPCLLVAVLSIFFSDVFKWSLVLLPIYSFILYFVGLFFRKISLGKKVTFMFCVGICVGVFLVFGVNFFVIASTKGQILQEKDYLSLKNVDCILVLGAKVEAGVPSPILEDRLLQAINLYKMGVAKKIIMSGDHGRESYDEVNTMKNFAIKNGVSSEDIFMDHAGFATYDSMVRAKEIFGAKKLIIVTQEYHLYRSLYIASSFGLEAYGVSSDIQKHSGQMGREIREILARDKDVVKCMFKPKPKYLGEVIPVNGNGDVTNDEKK